MTEWKKQVVSDALSELEDDFVAEAVEYQKAKPVWKYTRELTAIAACAAVLLLSINVLRMIPIGSMETVTEEVDREVIEVIVETPESMDRVIDELENYNKQIENNQKQEASENLVTESITTSSCVTWLSAEEILALDIDIFMGTVTGMDIYHVTGGMEKYFTVVTVEVEDSIRSELKAGESCRIYLPVAEVGDVKTTTSASGQLDQLKIGSRAIFMPHKATEKTGDGRGEAQLSYLDYSEYYFSEGARFLFLETETGTDYATDVYEIEGSNKASLEEVAAYLRSVLEK